MSDDRPKRDSMSLEEATISNMWEMAAIAELSQGYPLRSTSFGCFTPRPVPLFFSQSARLQAGWQGGDIMECRRCQGLMVEDHFFDFEGTQGFM
jgi:hypothetical protein